MDRVIDGCCRLLTALMVLMLALMVVLVFGNVVLRYGFNSGITASEEVSRWLFVWMTFLGTIVAVRDHAHLGTDVVVARLPKRGKQACLLLGQALMLYATWLVLKGSWAQAVINLDTFAPVTGAPVAVVYATGVVFAAAAGALLLRELWRTARGKVTEAELVMVQESEDLAQVRGMRAGAPPPRDAGR
jgi:TRAP-type C4-dicarboxylate transport system permease small subunit